MPPPKRAAAAKRPDLSVGGGGAFHTPHCPDGGSLLLESEQRRLEQAGGGSSLLESAQRRLEQAARDAFEREEGGSDDGSDVSDDVPLPGSLMKQTSLFIL